MSFVITLYVREGIVMASDSRMSLNTTEYANNGNTIVKVAVGQSDTSYKTFLSANNIGISTFGSAEINGIPIAGYIESFINDILVPNKLEVDQVPKEIINYFSKLRDTMNTGFFIAGYKNINNIAEQQLWTLDMNTKNPQRINENNEQGVKWGGESDILARMITPVAQHIPNGSYANLPHFQIPYGFFTLQDAIDFAIYAVKATIDSIRFQPRPKTVGGPIDVLVIKPQHAFWVQRKELHA